MRVPRKFSLAVQYGLDEWMPPRLRDSKLVMTLPMRLLFGSSARDVMSFKDWFWSASDAEVGALYERIGANELHGDSDLHPACADRLLQAIRGKKVLDAGCGQGWLAGQLAEHNDVTACDIIVDGRGQARYPSVRFVVGGLEDLPFVDGEFDVVVTTHALEHVRDLPRAITELRRVGTQHLHVVVPRQRPYRYTFSLHSQFFPYPWSFHDAFGVHSGATLERLGDWYYCEPLSS